MNERNVCVDCYWARDRRNGAHFCVKKGVLISYPKLSCKGYERERTENREQVREQENNR